MKQILSIFCFSAIFMPALSAMNISTAAQEPDWLVRLKRQKWMQKVAELKLLKTNRIEAEKVLGKPDDSETKNHSPIESYTIPEGEITLDYTTKECTSAKRKIAENTIKEISFYPKANTSFSKIRLPLKQFKRISSDVAGAAEYRNEQIGVSIFGDSNNDEIESVSFFIPENKNFSCVTVSSFLNDLNKIKSLKLLESNREDVRKIFAGYKKSDFPEDTKYRDKYFTGDATIEVFYSRGKCQFDNSAEYDNAEWNIERINVSPDNSIFPHEFGIDLSKYRKEQVYKNISDSYVYYDKNSGLNFWVSEGKIDQISFIPPQKYNSLMCDKDEAKILSATESIFVKKLKDRIYDYNENASVEKVYLSKREIIAETPNNNRENLQPDARKINVFARASSPRGDVLIYSYIVSAGKIIGRGERVIWDLSGIKAGTYKITVAVDDGCGFCGQPASNTVIIK